jgi:CHAT domain-containing protein
MGKAATEAHFTEGVVKARIIHLATHAKADDRSGDYSYLAFAPQKDNNPNALVYVRDLYNLRLNADLVVLSACETGIGKLQRGEGVISLVRAFAYSGAKAIVTSIWSVNDAKTKDLMVLFYQNLKRGQSKNEALRQAKLTYLEKYMGDACHPYFWSGFVSIGEQGAVR